MASSYIKKAVDPKTLKLIAEAVFEVFAKVEADVIVARGLSGSLVAAAVGAIYGAPFAIIRKPNEGSHSFERIEMAGDCARYGDWIIVDDFIASGNTLRTIAAAVREERKLAPWGHIAGKCKGIVLYNSYDSDDTFELDDDHTVPIFRVLNT